MIGPGFEGGGGWQGYGRVDPLWVAVVHRPQPGFHANPRVLSGYTCLLARTSRILPSFIRVSGRAAFYCFERICPAKMTIQGGTISDWEIQATMWNNRKNLLEIWQHFATTHRREDCGDSIAIDSIAWVVRLMTDSEGRRGRKNIFEKKQAFSFPCECSINELRRPNAS